MPGERIPRQRDGLLDEAEVAFREGDWPTLREIRDRVLRLDHDDQHAAALLAAAEHDAGLLRDRNGASTPIERHARRTCGRIEPLAAEAARADGPRSRWVEGEKR
jgi:hypothetical protein